MVCFFHNKVIICIHRVLSGLTVNKENFVENFTDFRKRFCHKWLELFNSYLWHWPQVNQCTSLQFHPGEPTTWQRWTTKKKMSLALSYSQDLTPCNVWLCCKPKETFRDSCFEDIEMNEAVTRILDIFTLEDFHKIFTNQMEHCNKYNEVRGFFSGGIQSFVHCASLKLINVSPINTYTHTCIYLF